MRKTGIAGILGLTRAGGPPAALAYAAFGVFGLAVAAVSGEPLHRLWGTCAAAGYACAALACLVPFRWRRELALAVAAAGALLVPLCWLAATGRGMPEVGVVAHSADLLIRHGRPYESARQLGADVSGYNPYLPGMTLFGLPQALLGGGLATDPRVWDGVVFAASFAAALRIAGCARPARWTAALATSPLIAFPLAVSGNDLPVLGLMCLGLAVAARPGPRRPPCARCPMSPLYPRYPPCPGWAGAVLGAAAVLKATAWPALLIAGVLIAVRDGRGAAARFAAASAAVIAAVAGPVLLIQPADLVQNTIGFPLGLTSAHSPAASPLPGHLLAATGQSGHLAVIALLAAAAAAIGIALITRPPRTAAAAAGYLVLTLTTLFTLAPATRWGYFVYPITIACWLRLSAFAPAPRPAPLTASPPPR